jgi:hypothetical protein
VEGMTYYSSDAKVNGGAFKQEAVRKQLAVINRTTADK